MQNNNLEKKANAVQEQHIDIANNENRVLVLFAHPAFQLSVTNKQLIKAYDGLDNVTVRDLYALHPRFFLEAHNEQELLLNHDIIIFHFPLHWYNMPPLLKHWQDITLTSQFIFGVDKNSSNTDVKFSLENKKLMIVTSTGGTKESYSSTGNNKKPVMDYLSNIEQMTQLCRMKLLPPFVVYGANDSLDSNHLEKKSLALRMIMQEFKRYNDDDFNDLKQYQYLNELAPCLLDKLDQ